MLHLLTSLRVCRAQLLPADWSVLGVLRAVAAGGFQAFIDAGALITNLSNLDVARILLGYLPSNMQGVVFLDSADCQMVLLRSSGRVRASCVVCRVSCVVCARPPPTPTV
jgi:hypothetical protein